MELLRQCLVIADVEAMVGKLGIQTWTDRDRADALAIGCRIMPLFKVIVDDGLLGPSFAIPTAV
jgi:hypothetical protein